LLLDLIFYLKAYDFDRLSASRRVWGRFKKEKMMKALDEKAPLSHANYPMKCIALSKFKLLWLKLKMK